MKSIIIFLLNTLLFSLGTSVSVYGDEAPDPDIVEISKFWPEKVTVNIDITGVTHGNTVKSGRDWTFLRYEDGKCLVDMGHNGIHSLDIEDTDILERMNKISEERPSDFQGLFTFYYTKTFYDPKTLQGLQLGELDQYDYFVLFYFDYERDSEITKALSSLIENYLKKFNDEMKLQVLLIPCNDFITDEKSYENYVEDGLIAPTQAILLREGTVHTLKHNYKEKGDVVLVDNFGKVIKQFFLSDLDDSKLFKTIKNAVEEESSKAKQVKTESVRKNRNSKK